MIVVRVVAFVAGAALILSIVLSAVQTLVIPRALPVTLTRSVFLVVRWVFQRTMRRSEDFERVDRRFAFYAPASLFALVAVWMTVLLAAYALMFWGLGASPWASIAVSGSSLFTLGTDHPQGRPATLLSFTAAGLGIGVLALVITYLPSIYAAFQRREALVALLEVRAGTPPWAVTMLERYQLIGLADRSDELWQRSEEWFADVRESHTSIGSLPFFRSPEPQLHWVTAAGAVLDAASLSMAALEGGPQPNAALCVRSGYLAMRRIADFFGIPYDADPRPDDPISIRRDEIEAALDRLEAIGAPVKRDRDQVWRDFVGWRVNYDTVLITLAGLTLAPPAPWSGDRAVAGHRPPLLFGRRKR
jgi:hypothetical protein